MTNRSRYLGLGLISLVLWWGNGSTTFADTPTEQVKETIDRVIEILQDPMTGEEARKTERREMLRQVLLPRFDFPEMARRSLGSHWKSQKARQKEFVSAFTDFVEKSYIIKIESFKDEKIVYVGERVDEDFAEVDTKILPSKGDGFSIRYKLHLVGDEWKVYDVLVENVSLVNNYRSQFNRILATAPFDELLKRLQEKGFASGS